MNDLRPQPKENCPKKKSLGAGGTGNENVRRYVTQKRSATLSRHELDAGTANVSYPEIISRHQPVEQST